MEATDLPNLASAQLGAKIVFATDEWFASADNMISDLDAVWKADDYTPFGKWMDGWESRRRRTEGHDWCIVKLGIPGIIKAIEVDTAFFTGNFSPKVSIFGANLTEDGKSAPILDKLDDLRVQSVQQRPEHGRMGLCASEAEFAAVSHLQSENWNVLVPLTPLGAGYEETRKTMFRIAGNSDTIASHIRVNMGPDGGIARIRVYGEVVVSASAFEAPSGSGSDRNSPVQVDLAAVQHGGQAVAWSNKHYGHPRNLIAPGRGNCMGDGWETARQPKRPPVYQKGPDGLMLLPGYDWALLKLGVKGVITSLEVDTNFYKGNYPESCLVEACVLPKEATADRLQTEEQQLAVIQQTASDSSAGAWKVLLPRTRLGPGAQHFFTAAANQINNIGPVSHLKITIYPDGGVMRLRAIGFKSPEGNSRL